MIKKIALIFSVSALSCAASDSLLKPANDLGYGTWSARLQTLSMYRDYENNNPGSAYSTTLGIQLGYQSPEWQGISFGGAYSYAEPMDASDSSDNGKTLLSNGRINLLNEAWGKYRLETTGLTNTWIKAGRQVINGEVFRADEFRQKPRTLEAVTLTTKDIPNTVVTIGHAWRLSNWMDNKESWKFKDFGKDIFGAANYDYDTRGVTWIESLYTGITNLELAVYDAYAYDVANIAGGRAKYKITDSTAVNGYYRHENDVGRGIDHHSDMYGASIEQRAGEITFEPGFFSVHGDTLLFQETTTGINHPLGLSMLIYPSVFNGGADTVYLKATTKIGKTALYALYNYTWQDHSKTAYDGQELNLVAKQPITDCLSVTLKAGAGYRDSKNAADNTVATDSRLFVTYNF